MGIFIGFIIALLLTSSPTIALAFGSVSSIGPKIFLKRRDEARRPALRVRAALAGPGAQTARRARVAGQRRGDLLRPLPRRAAARRRCRASGSAAHRGTAGAG